MSQFLVGNILLVVAIFLTAGSQVLFKFVFNKTGPIRVDYSAIQALDRNLLYIFLLAFAMLVASFLFWLLSLSRLDLSYAYAVACTSVVLVALFSIIFLDEMVSTRMVLGIVLIAIGTALVGAYR